jgi:hypothetical protein
MEAMLTDRAFMALADLDSGLRINCSHAVAKELIAAGLAIDNFGFLELTEVGRKAARVKSVRQFVIDDGNVADLSFRIDPMANPMAPPEPITHAVLEEPITPEPLPPPDDYTRGLRAAGVATGITGVKVETNWVVEFVKAYVEMS